MTYVLFSFTDVGRTTTQPSSEPSLDNSHMFAVYSLILKSLLDIICLAFLFLRAAHAFY